MSGVLAYVFWHWPRPSAGRAAYEARQRSFHAALQAAPPSGFLSSFCMAVADLPWLEPGRDAYEDWYRVESFTALETLNEGAVSGSRQSSHDAAASMSAGGMGGLYRLRAGVELERPTLAHWFGKPEGWSYAELLERLAPLVEGGGSALWVRQMVLGPGTEFCLHMNAAVDVPSDLAAHAASLQLVWPDPGTGS